MLDNCYGHQRRYATMERTEEEEEYFHGEKSHHEATALPDTDGLNLKQKLN